MNVFDSESLIGNGEFSRRSVLKGVSMLAAGLALSTFNPVEAVAEETAGLVWPAPTGARNNTIAGKSVLKCYAPSTNTMLTEILGLSNPSFYSREYTQYQADLCTSPTLGIWGSSANAQPNDFLSNLIYKSKGKEVDEKYTAVIASALQGTSQFAAWDDEDGLPLFMKHRPEMYAITDGDSWSNAGKTTAELIGVINGFKEGDGHYQAGDETYNPTFVDFRGHYGKKLGYMYSMWELAEQAEKLLAADSTKCARYGSPLAQAATVEKFMVASQYAVLKAIADGKVKRRTIAIVGGMDNAGAGITSGVNTTVGRARIDRFAADNVRYDNDTQWDSTTMRNVRYYHATSALESVSDSIASKYTPKEYDAETYETDLTGTEPIVKDADGILWARPEVLLECDAIIIRGSVLDGGGSVPGAKAIYQLLLNTEPDPKKWPEVYNSVPQFAGYGASNCGAYFWWYSYMLFVYPEVINPVYMSRYMLHNIYHLAESYVSDALEIVCGKMSLPTGYELTTAGYSEAALESTLNAGIKYYQANKAEIDEKYPNLKMTDQMEAWLKANPIKDTPDPKPQPALVDPKVITGKNAYTVMAAEILDAYKSASTVIVVGNTAGAAAAVSLARAYSAPIIDAQAILHSPSTVSSLLKKLGCKRYVIVGGKKAVPSSVISKLKKMGCKAKRARISATSSEALSVAVAKVKVSHGTTAVVVSGTDTKGLMAAATYAYKIKAPVIIVGKKLSLSAKAVLKKYKSAVVVGSGVSAAAYKAIPCKKRSRVSGTGATLVQKMTAKQLGAGLKAAGSLVIAPTKKSDCIAASVVAAKKGVTIIPVSSASLATPAKLVLAKKPANLTVVGVTSSATTSLVNAVKKAIN